MHQRFLRSNPPTTSDPLGHAISELVRLIAVKAATELLSDSVTIIKNNSVTDVDLTVNAFSKELTIPAAKQQVSKKHRRQPSLDNEPRVRDLGKVLVTAFNVMPSLHAVCMISFPSILLLRGSTGIKLC